MKHTDRFFLEVQVGTGHRYHMYERLEGSSRCPASRSHSLLISYPPRLMAKVVSALGTPVGTVVRETTLAYRGVLRSNCRKNVPDATGNRSHVAQWKRSHSLNTISDTPPTPKA